MGITPQNFGPSPPVGNISVVLPGFYFEGSPYQLEEKSEKLNILSPIILIVLYNQSIRKKANSFLVSLSVSAGVINKRVEWCMEWFILELCGVEYSWIAGGLSCYIVLVC